LGGVFVIYNLRSMLPSIILLLYSFWIPQIVHNASNNVKRGLKREYLYGMSFTRLVTPLYFYANPQNFLALGTDYNFSAMLVLFVLGQVIVLEMQGE
jgi:transmembrane E3 ubiquitin-protein ligase